MLEEWEQRSQNPLDTVEAAVVLLAGLSVLPHEVEDVLLQHPAVAEAVVAGVPDPYRGETVRAWVVLKPGFTVTTDYLLGWLHDRLPAYKVPTRVDIVENMSGAEDDSC
ncbi:MAG: hypothetical protein M0Z53_02915 [Thermaerobacter sp.]|nr:hypothetical protein [Thermaerobacter sp.]